MFHSPSGRTFLDPYGGVKTGLPVSLATADTLPVDVDPARLDQRKYLLTQFDGARRALDAPDRSPQFDRYQKMAFG